MIGPVVPGAIFAVSRSPEADCSALAYAIRGRFVVGFDYPDEKGIYLWREVEPHLLGENSHGETILRAFDTLGSGASGSAVAWKTFLVSRMKHVTVSARSFKGPRPGYTTEDGVLARVICRV